MKKKRLIAVAILVASIALIGVAIIGYMTKSVNIQHAEGTKLAYIKKEASLSDIKKDDGVVNIYMFWGNGCPHCEAQWENIEALREEYPNDFKVYGFELWYHKDNMEILNIFAEAVGDEPIDAVPYTIIGDRSYSGAMSKEELTKAIKNNKNKNNDVYFTKIK